MWIYSKQDIFDVLKDVTLNSLLPSRVFAAKFGQIKNIISVKDNQSFFIFRLFCPISMIIPFNLLILLALLHLLKNGIIAKQQIKQIIVTIQLIDQTHMQNKLTYNKFSFSSRVLGQQGNIDKSQQEQYQLLKNKFYELESQLAHEGSLIKKYKFQIEKLQKQTIQKIETISQLKLENKSLKDLALALKEEINQIKLIKDSVLNENSIIKQKNYQICDIVKMLEKQKEQLQNKQESWKYIQEGLRNRIQQLITQNQNIRRKMAKSEVESQKYKLKAIQGQKYWSSKIQKNKHKDEQFIIFKLKDLDQKHQNELIQVKAEVFRYQKILKIKQERIKYLQDKIEQILFQNNK